jgi:alcohol dehydrogenase (cytochrome c)
MWLAFFAAAVAGILKAADPISSDWPIYNRTLTGERYAPLDQINRTNLARLKQVCVYDLDVDAAFESGPIVVGQTLYATTASDTIAIDAHTCQQKWRIHEEGSPTGLRVNRVVAFIAGTRTQVFPVSAGSAKIVVFGL